MAKPMGQDEVKLKRLIRYLRHKPRGIYHYPWQDPTALIHCYVDSDWAGCTRTRKSTSGGALMRGNHCLHQWSRTQACIALSSGEAELNAALKGGTELIGARTLLHELGVEAQLEILGDSTACHGTLHREGTGRIKHLELKQLWLQAHVKSGSIKYTKIDRSRNPADSLAKHWSTDGPNHFSLLNFTHH